MPLTKRSTVHAVGRGALTPPHKKGAAELCGARNTPNQSNYHIIF